MELDKRKKIGIGVCIGAVAVSLILLIMSELSKSSEKPSIEAFIQNMDSEDFEVGSESGDVDLHGYEYTIPAETELEYKGTITENEITERNARMIKAAEESAYRYNEDILSECEIFSQTIQWTEDYNLDLYLILNSVLTQYAATTGKDCSTFDLEEEMIEEEGFLCSKIKDSSSGETIYIAVTYYSDFRDGFLLKIEK